MDTPSRFGDFGFRTVVDTFEHRIADMDPVQQRFGLSLQVQYLYGGLTRPDGAQYILERKLVGPMTGGCWLMSDESGATLLRPEALNTARGETIREFTSERRRWSNHLMHELGARLRPSEDQPLEIEMTDTGLVWNEGEYIRLTGQILGPGFQYYMPMREDPLFYTTSFYWMTGTVFGEPVTGFVGIDHGYWTPGSEWKEYTVFKELELAWEVFGNRYGDSTEWGVIVKGRRGLSAAICFEDGDVVAMSDDMPTTCTLSDDHRYVETVTFDIGEEQYRFTASDRGRMHSFNEARWGGYTSQGGVTRRLGDTRTPDNSFCWIETFPGRLFDDGYSKA